MKNHVNCKLMHPIEYYVSVHWTVIGQLVACLLLASLSISGFSLLYTKEQSMVKSNLKDFTQHCHILLTSLQLDEGLFARSAVTPQPNPIVKSSIILPRRLATMEAINITYTNSSKTSNHWITEHILAAKDASEDVVVGFDLEWKPNTQKYEQENRIALLQLSINDKVLMFHVSRCRIDGAPYFIDIESPLHELLVDSKYLKVGAASHNDAKKIHRDFEVQLNGVVDISDLSHKLYCKHVRNALGSHLFGLWKESEQLWNPSSKKLSSYVKSGVIAPFEAVNFGRGFNSPLDVDAVGTILKTVHSIGVRTILLPPTTTSTSGDSQSPYFPKQTTPVIVNGPPTPANIVSIPKRASLLRSGLSALAETYLNLILTKKSSLTLSNWEAPLSNAQIKYAALDGWVGSALYLRLSDELSNHQA